MPGWSDTYVCLNNRLEKHFANAKIADLEQLIKLVNDLVKDHSYSLDERNYFKRLRQRVYDRRRVFDKVRHSFPLVSQVNPQSEIPQSSPFVAGAKRALSQIDGERFVKALPAAVAIFCATLFVTGFLWLQSVELYQSSSFKQPEMAATGAMLMALGFAGYHAVVRSWLALLLCAYIASYEVYFVVQGTFEDENQQQLVAIESNPDLKILQESANRAEESYQLAKAHYDDPGSKMYKNQWYKSTTLDRAWMVHQDAQKGMVSKRTALQATSNSTVACLKVLYRLGLVFLCMILTHRLCELLGARGRSPQH